MTVTPKNYTQFAGYRSCRKSRLVGTTISVVDGKAQNLDTTGGRWYSICEDHNTTVSHESQAIATSHASQPHQ